MSEFSIEFFPPRDAKARETLERSLKELRGLAFSHASVTSGALGSADEGSCELIGQIQETTPWPVTPHFVLGNKNLEDIDRQLQTHRQRGIEGLLVLRGDKRPFRESGKDSASFSHASDLIAYIKKQSDFRILAAAYPEGHPEAFAPEQDWHWLCEKLNAGASGLVTQFVYEKEPLLRMRDYLARHGKFAPIWVGIMPIHNLPFILKLAASCQARLPSSWIRELEGLEGPALLEASSRRLGDLIRDLEREGFSCFHLYALNRFRPALALFSELKIAAQAA